jgi:hypothetical protein
VTSSDDAADFGACSSWPDGFNDHLDRYRQGHIVDGIPVFFLQSEVELWSRPRQTIGSAETTLLVGEVGHPHRRAMLLTQACDLMKPKNPWITVCPVYDAARRLQQGQEGQIKAGQIPHLVPITAEWAAEGFWVADLRLEMSLEKTVLMGNDPIEAFNSDDEYSDLALRLGARRNRPATPQSCLDLVINPLFDALRALPDGGTGINTGLRELRVSWNDHNAPTVVTVFVIVGKDADQSHIDVDGWEALILGLYQNASEGGITIVGPEITTFAALSAADYIQSSAIEDTVSS